MKNYFISIITIASLMVLLLCWATTSKPEDYQPTSAREKKVLDVPNKMVEVRENRDFETYMSFFHEDAKIFKRVPPRQ